MGVTMSLKSCLEKILTEWPTENKKPFKDNQLAVFIRENFVNEVQSLTLNEPQDLQVKASAGAGNWASIPWLSILDPSITTSTQDGIYPVYLFCADARGVYLSLGQGMTRPTKEHGAREAANRVKGVSHFLRNKISELEFWTAGELTLNSPTALGRSYEKPNIGYKFYPQGNIPSNDELISDLNSLLSIYKKVRDLWPEISAPSVFIDFDEKQPERTNKAKKTSCNVSLPKPFLLLAGISGTGKTRFVREQAKASARAFGLSKGDNYCLVPVRPDWHEPSDLLGYISRINGTRYIATDFLKFMVKALVASIDTCDETEILWKSWDQVPPFWLCLDEMNLAPVEQYFADYLSILETRKWDGADYSSEPMMKSVVFYSLITKDKDGAEDCSGLDELCKTLFGSVPEELAAGSVEKQLWSYFNNNGIPLPPNLIVAGTVNMDETTHGFSRKVIDRALTIDFQEFFKNDFDAFFEDDENPQHNPILFSFPTASSAVNEETKALTSGLNKESAKTSRDFLNSINTILKATPFELAYRALNELLLSVSCFGPYKEGDQRLAAVWDDFLMQKVLPRIEGDSAKLKNIPDPSVSCDSLIDKEYGKGTVLHALYNLLETDLFSEIWPEDLVKAKRPDLLRESSNDDGPLLIECRSKKKLEWMMKRLKTNHFTDFWV